MLYRQSKTEDVASTIRQLKATSSSWIKANGGVHEFAWQVGYGAFSVGAREIPQIVHYIETQEEHHKTVSFKDELRGLLEEYGVPYDEKYLWEDDDS